MANKSVPKKVKFDYYEVVQEVDESALIDLIHLLEEDTQISSAQKEFLQKLKEIQKSTDSYTYRYDIEPLLKLVKAKKIKQNIAVNDKIVELDVSTFLPMPDDIENNDVVFFQVTNCRDINVPSKKKIGQEREEIKLADDEYIGEFMSIIYYKLRCAIMV